MTEAEQVMKRCQIGTRNYEEANNLHAECYRVIGKLLAEHAMQKVQRLGQEIEQCQCPECQIKPHASDCAVHSEPAYPKGKCDCGAQPQQEPPKYSFKAHWEKDGRIGVVGAVVRPDGGVHLLQDFIDPPQPEQAPVAVYGYCPECGAKGVMRERRPNGNDKCANGHTYPSSVFQYLSTQRSNHD